MVRRSTRALAIPALLILAAAPLSGQSQERIYPTGSDRSGWQTVDDPGALGIDTALLDQARDYAMNGGTPAGLVIWRGQLLYSWGDANLDLLHDVKSVTKAVGSAALGFALQEGRLTLADRAQDHLPSFGTTPASNDPAWLASVTIEHLATQSAGFEKSDGLRTDPQRCQLLTQPGTQWAYSDCGINWLADILTTSFNQDLFALLNERLFRTLGIDVPNPLDAAPQPGTDLTWRRNIYRDQTLNEVERRELASGIQATVDALARIGLLFARDGVWSTGRILPEGFLSQISQPASSIADLSVDNPTDYPDANRHYGIMWWNNGDGALQSVPTDAIWGWGEGDHLLVVIPSLDLVIVRTGLRWDTTCAGFCARYAALEPFIAPIVAAVPGNTAPQVDAGPDQSVQLPNGATLTGSATDDGLPANGTLTYTWTLESGSGATIASPSSPSTTVTFQSAGTYVFRLTVSDGVLSASDDVQVTGGSSGGGGGGALDWWLLAAMLLAGAHVLHARRLVPLRASR